MPLFHRPRFYEEYHVHRPDHEQRYQGLELEAALVLNAMFALSARFSRSDRFVGVSIRRRAEHFLEDAKKLYHEAMSLDAPMKPNIRLLQGFTLLGWCYQLCGNPGQSWMLSGLCCHLSYELGLNKIDENIIDGALSPQWTSVEEWSFKEGLRRLWWLVWELDMFSSTVLNRPHTIQKAQIKVLLPVSDEKYCSNTPIASAPILHDSMLVWKSLINSPNQDARAWFLVVSFIRALSHDLLSVQTSMETVTDFQSALACFSIVLPPSFQLGPDSMKFCTKNFSSNNWVISIHLMLQT